MEHLFGNPLAELDAISQQAKKIDAQNRELKFKLENPMHKWKEYNEAFPATNKLSAEEQIALEDMEEDNQ